MRDDGPRQFALAGPLAPGWTLAEPLLLWVEREEDGYVVLSDDIFGVYGDGATPEEARRDYVRSLIDYYELLAKSAPENAQHAGELAHLRIYLCREAPGRRP